MWNFRMTFHFSTLICFDASLNFLSAKFILFDAWQSKDINISKSYQRVSKFPFFNFHCLSDATRRASCFVHSGSLASRFRAAKIRHSFSGERIFVRLFFNFFFRLPKAIRRVTEGRQEKYKETRDKYRVTKELSTKYKRSTKVPRTQSQPNPYDVNLFSKSVNYFRTSSQLNPYGNWVNLLQRYSATVENLRWPIPQKYIIIYINIYNELIFTIVDRRKRTVAL